jgi:DMSO/TMAO reductase YedYZ molybdopterin-dependent catalytic subunit
MAITSRIYTERGKRRAAKLGIPADRLPPGQSPTLKFPVLTVGPTPEVPPERWSLSVYGEVSQPYGLKLGELLALEQTTITTDLHCVTRWSKFDSVWTGVRVRDILERAQPHAEASHVLIHSYGGYSTNLPLEDLLGDNVLVAHRYDNAPLPHEHGGPVRLLVPHLYLWKSAKWVQSLEMRSSDELGFWERNGYHHRGDPWKEERRSVGEYVARMRRLES